MIRQKNNQWQVRVYAGRDPITGRERFEYGTAPNERTAKKLEGRLMTEVADGRRKGTKVKTVADLMDQWFEWRKTSGEGLSPGTAYNYERDITLRILPGLGRLSLRELDAATLDDFLYEAAPPRRQVPAVRSAGAGRRAAAAGRGVLPPAPRRHRAGA